MHCWFQANLGLLSLVVRSVNSKTSIQWKPDITTSRCRGHSSDRFSAEFPKRFLPVTPFASR